MSGKKEIVYCVDCGDIVPDEPVKRFVMRGCKCQQVCTCCYSNVSPRRLDNPYRELGFPDAAGGKVAPGNYQWRSRNGPGS